MAERIAKVNELIKQKLGQIIAREIEFPENALVTITMVQTTPDIKASKVFISVLPEKFRGTALETLRKNKKNIRNLLKKQMTTKFVPNLNFLVDEQEIFASEIDKLLDELK